MEQDKVNRLSDVEKNVWDEDSEVRSTVKQEKKAGLRQRWNEVQLTKTMVFWTVVTFIILTMIVGFNWGGWVTNGTAQKMAETTANEAIVQRLTPICVAQFNEDLGKIQKLRELKAAKVYERDDYVIKQGWATIPGEEKPDNKVANECAKLLAQLNQ